MKHIMLFFVTLFLLLESSQAQESQPYTNPDHSYYKIRPHSSAKYSSEYYAVQSSKLNTAGFVLLSTGAVFGITGWLIKENNKNNEYRLYQLGEAMLNTAGSEILMFAGSAMVLASIPILISAGENRRKALRMSAALKLESGRELNEMGLSLKHYPAVGLKIQL
jgi:hypothetical protein